MFPLFHRCKGPVSSATAKLVDDSRQAVLQHFGASPREWTVVFTSGATTALKTVGEQFPWRPGGTFVHARSSHNSVLGVREYARASGAEVECVDLNECPRFKSAFVQGLSADDDRYFCECDHFDESIKVGDAAVDDRERGEDTNANANAHFPQHPTDAEVNNEDQEGVSEDADVVDCLFAFPAECNATGARADLAIAGRVKEGALSRRRSGDCCRCDRVNGMKRSRRNATEDVRDIESTVDEAERGGGEPVASNVGGRRRALGKRPKERWWVMLDAAKYVGTATLDLSKVEADFVALSFYKIFG